LIVRMSWLVFPALLMASPAAAEYHPQPLGVLWHKGNAAILVTSCKTEIGDDPFCHGLALRKGGKVRQLGGGYLRARLLWSRKAGGAGPDVLVLGESGGSGGYGELFAVTFSPKPAVAEYSEERLDMVEADPSAGPLRLTLPFDIEYFNGAPHAGAVIVQIPTIWRNGDFAADMPALLARHFSASEIDFRVLALREELAGWAEDAYPAGSLYPPQSSGGTPVTVRALLEMILSGHADQARMLLHNAWPRSHQRTDRPLGGEEAFWKALCQGVVREPLWKRLRLSRLPHADIVEGGGERRLIRSSPQR
jgi:hypothetical protein